MSARSSKRKSNQNGHAQKKFKKNEKATSDEEIIVDSKSESSLDQSNSDSDESDKDYENQVDLGLHDENDSLRVQGPEHLGKVLICGATNWDLVGRKAAPKGCKTANKGRNVYSPIRFAPLDNIKVHAVVSGCNAAHSVIITETWKAMVFGRNEKGQLGTGNTKRVDIPVELKELKDLTVVGAACGRNHTLFLTDRGTVYACGDNKMGQCGVGSNNPMVEKPTRIRYKGPAIVKVVCGADFSIILDCKGSLHSFGSPEYGQLGHNSTGEYIEKAGKVQFDYKKSPKMIGQYVDKINNQVTPMEGVDIRDVACGTNHTLALDSRKRVFSWGFGGYGHLGHANTKDEMVPRLIKFFEHQGKGIKSIYAGHTFSVCITDQKVSYMIGQTTRTKDANMYPKPMEDLYGWDVRSLASGTTAIVLAADDSVISFGPPPSYGEQGHGEFRKTTQPPLEVKALNGIYVEQVAMGMHHTLLLARYDTDEDKDKVDELPEYMPK